MKYGKLIEIRKKARFYERIVTTTFIIACVLLILHIALRWYDVANPTLIGITFIIAALLLITFFVSMVLERKQNSHAIDYFVIRIMDVLNEQGIDSSNFEIIEEGYCYYRVGFRNQTVDYDNLQDVLDKEVIAMSKIMNANMRVKLI